MSESSLVAALQAAVDASPRPAIRSSGAADWADIKAEQVKPFASALRNDPELKGIWGKWFQLPDGSGGTFQPELAAVYLTGRAREGIPGKRIIQSLLQFAQTGKVEFVKVHALINIEVSAKFELAKGVFLLPPAELDDNMARAHAFYSKWRDDEFPLQMGKAALAMNFSLNALCERPDNTDDILENSPLENELTEAFSRARIALIAAGGAAPKFGASYGYIRKLGWPSMSEPGSSWSSARQASPYCIDSSHQQAMQSIYERAGRCDTTIALVLNRLSASRTKLDEIDRFIDLGSCLEMLLMKGSGSDNAEITNKIRNRGAWLLGKNLDDRKHISKTIKDIYAFRSKAVHSGTLPKHRNMADSERQVELLKNADSLVSRLIDRLLNGFPDWDDLVLGRDE